MFSNFAQKHHQPDLISAIACFLICAGLSIGIAHAGPVLPEPANIPKAEPRKDFPQIKDPGIEDKARPAMQQSLSEEAILIQVDSFTFSGNSSITSNQLASLLQHFTGRQLSMRDLNQAVDLVTLHYRQKGFLLAQAYLPEQEISNNAVEIAVIEGLLDELEFNSADGLDETFLMSIAKRQLQAADTIRENNLVRNITLLNSLPGIKAVAQLNPGTKTGTSDATITLEVEPRWQGILSANTFGNRYTGREVLDGTLFLNNLAGRGDQATLNLRSSNHERQRGIQLGYMVPVHASGTLLNLNYSFVDYRLGGEFSILKASGDSEYISMGLDQPLVRSRHQNLTVRTSISHKEVNDDVATFLLKNHRNIEALDLGLYADWRDRKSSGFNQLGLNIKAGDVDFRNSIAQNLDDTGAQTAGEFIKYNLFVSRIQPVSQRINLTMHAEYQGTNKNLDSAEKLSIGGINRWRNFAELPTSADRGLIAGVELRATMAQENPLASFLHASTLSPYVFYDAGRGIINHSALSKDNHVKSTHAGMGVDAVFAQRWYLGLALSHQKRELDGSEPEHETRAWGQIQMVF